MYKYRDLHPTAKEIRVLQLLPGAFEEDIRVKFRHVALAQYEKPSFDHSTQAPIATVQQVPPAGWVKRRCLDGRFLFERVKDYGPEEPYETTWAHPVTGVSLNDEVGATLEYEALSYVWAPEGAEHQARVLKPSVVASTSSLDASEGTISIRSNLTAALRHLRHRDRERCLWVDALCINQADLTERSSQVRLMHDIYRLASRVVVWLGSERENSKLAVTALSHLGRQVVHTEGGAWLTSLPGCEEPAMARSSVPLPYDVWTWRSILDLLKRPWFERLWVWQEIRLADERSIMMCGFDSITLSLFRRAVFCASDKRTLPNNEIRGLILDAVELMLPSSHQPFFRELQMLNWKGCSDPRDKIYGALGAAPPLIRDNIRPDYTLSAQQVYRGFCIAYLEQLGRLDFLDRCNLDARQIGGPTWVPDWSVSVDRAVRLPYADVFYAAGASAAALDSHGDGGIDSIQPKGVPCGDVSFVGDKAPFHSEDLVATVKSWGLIALATKLYRPTGEDALDAFMALLGLGYSRERWPQCHSLLTLPEMARLYTDAFSTGGADRAAVTESLNFIRVRHRYFFVTDTGYMGVAHARPEVGDRLVVLFGCPLPLLLRPTTSGASRAWQVVGPVYSYGLMDTEALLGLLPRGWVVRMSREEGFFDSMHYFNEATGEKTQEDPRLGLDPSEWERLEAKRTSNDPWNFSRYRHRETGNIINSDPRITPEAIEARGVAVEPFQLM